MIIAYIGLFVLGTIDILELVFKKNKTDFIYYVIFFIITSILLMYV